MNNPWDGLQNLISHDSLDIRRVYKEHTVMTDREAVHLLNRTNRRHALLNSPVMTEEQIATWSSELRAGLLELNRAGYSLKYATDGLRPRYVFREPAETIEVE